MITVGNKRYRATRSNLPMITTSQIEQWYLSDHKIRARIGSARMRRRAISLAAENWTDPPDKGKILAGCKAQIRRGKQRGLASIGGFIFSAILSGVISWMVRRFLDRWWSRRADLQQFIQAKGSAV